MLNLRSVRHLARRLRVSLETLEGLVAYHGLQYNPGRHLEKPDGRSVRVIDAPRALLKSVQRKIHSELLAPAWLPDSVHAYRVGRSIRSASVPHEGARFLWVADIRKFYPSISYQTVYRIFSRLGCSPDVARILTRLTTHRGRLPQGAPTSPGLANLFLRFSGLAARLQGISRKRGLRVTFFGDDILISSERPFEGLRMHLSKIITSTRLRLHPEKTRRVVGPREGHRVLGIILNSGGNSIDVPRSYRRRVKTLLRVCQRYGPGGLAVAGVKTKDPKAYLRGRIAFAVWVNPRNKDLQERFNQLTWPES